MGFSPSSRLDGENGKIWSKVSSKAENGSRWSIRRANVAKIWNEGSVVSALSLPPERKDLPLAIALPLPPEPKAPTIPLEPEEPPAPPSPSADRIETQQILKFHTQSATHLKSHHQIRVEKAEKRALEAEERENGIKKELEVVKQREQELINKLNGPDDVMKKELEAAKKREQELMKELKEAHENVASLSDKLDFYFRHHAAQNESLRQQCEAARTTANEAEKREKEISKQLNDAMDQVKQLRERKDKATPKSKRFKSSQIQDPFAPESGDGKCSYADGSEYEGNFLNSKRHGKGVLTLSDGTKYDSEWMNDLRHGHGREVWPNGTVFDGDYVNGKRQGHGEMHFPEGEIKSYIGQFEDDQAEGQAQLTRVDGSVYTGQFSKGSMSGEGKMVWTDGKEYVGQFKNNLREGKGKMIWVTGKWKMYDGEWREGREHGRGTLIDQSNTAFVGIFHEGQLQSHFRPQSSSLQL